METTMDAERDNELLDLDSPELDSPELDSPELDDDADTDTAEQDLSYSDGEDGLDPDSDDGTDEGADTDGRTRTVRVREFVGRPGAPSSKAVMTVQDALVLMEANPGKGVRYSTGHTQGAARLKAKRIQRGRIRSWADAVGDRPLRASAVREPGGTYAVYVGFLAQE